MKYSRPICWVFIMARLRLAIVNAHTDGRLIFYLLLKQLQVSTNVRLVYEAENDSVYVLSRIEHV